MGKFSSGWFVSWLCTEPTTSLGRLLARVRIGLGYLGRCLCVCIYIQGKCLYPARRPNFRPVAPLSSRTTQLLQCLTHTTCSWVPHALPTHPRPYPSNRPSIKISSTRPLAYVSPTSPLPLAQAAASLLRRAPPLATRGAATGGRMSCYRTLRELQPAGRGATSRELNRRPPCWIQRTGVLQPAD